MMTIMKLMNNNEPDENTENEHDKHEDMMRMLHIEDMMK